MLADEPSHTEDDIDILCNMVSVLKIEYDVVTEVIDDEEDFPTENMDIHKVVCFYVTNDNYVKKKNTIFEKPDAGMKSYLKFTYAKQIAFHAWYIKYIGNY